MWSKIKNSLSGAAFFGVIAMAVSFVSLMFLNSSQDVVNTAFLIAVFIAFVEGVLMVITLFVIGLLWEDEKETFGAQFFALAALYFYGFQTMGVRAFVEPVGLVYVLVVTMWPLMLAIFVGIPAVVFVGKRLFGGKPSDPNTPQGPDTL